MRYSDKGRNIFLKNPPIATKYSTTHMCNTDVMYDGISGDQTAILKINTAEINVRNLEKSR